MKLVIVSVLCGMDEVDKECEYEIFSTIEKRTYYVLNELAYFTDYLKEQKGLKKIFAVKREIERNGKKQQK